MSFPAEKLSSLRQLIHSKINDLGVQDKIKECIDTGDSERGGASEEHLLSRLRDKGVIDDILASLKLSKDVTDEAIDSVDDCTCEQEKLGGTGERFIRVICNVLTNSICISEAKQKVCVFTSNGRKGICGALARVRDDTRVYPCSVYSACSL